jgi:hypothetical protein
VRSANLMDLAASLPRPCALVSKRYQWIERFLGKRGKSPGDQVGAERSLTRSGR